jgi:hypothetical protein
MKSALTLLTALLLVPPTALAQNNENPGTSTITPKLLPTVEIAGTAWELDGLPQGLKLDRKLGVVFAGIHRGRWEWFFELKFCGVLTELFLFFEFNFIILVAVLVALIMLETDLDKLLVGSAQFEDFVDTLEKLALVPVVFAAIN